MSITSKNPLPLTVCCCLSGHQTNETSTERDRYACLERLLSPTSSRFPNFDTSNAWQMSHNSREAFFLGQELLLDFAAWIDLTSNNDNMSISSLEHQSTFWFFKMCWWLTGLSRLYDASQPPGRHARYFKTRLKILVDRALRQHALLPFNARSIHVLCFKSQ